MLSAMKFPSSYYQGRNALLEFPQWAMAWGKSFLFIGSKSALKAGQPKLEKAFEGLDCPVRFELCSGIPCKSEIDRLRAISDEMQPDVVCAMGGGSIMDVCRAIALNSGRNLIMIPTACASDAPCTYVSVFYSEDGTTIVGDQLFHKCPDMVYVDLDILANAPARLMISGMGDALATIYEATTCYKNGIPAGQGYRFTNTAMVLAQTAKDLILENGFMALQAAKAHLVTPAFEKVVEANTFLSGIGGLNTGCAGAHGIADILSSIPGGHDWMHGERVAVGLVAQLILEGYKEEEIAQVINFCQSVELPCTIAELGMDVESTAWAVAEKSVGDHFITNMNCDISPEAIHDALVTAVILAGYEEEDEHEHCCCH